MSTVPLACANCGASLEVPESVVFATCSYCRSSLKIEGTGGVFYSTLAASVQRVEQGVGEIQAATHRTADEAALERIEQRDLPPLLRALGEVATRFESAPTETSQRAMQAWRHVAAACMAAGVLMGPFQLCYGVDDLWSHGIGTYRGLNFDDPLFFIAFGLLGLTLFAFGLRLARKLANPPATREQLQDELDRAQQAVDAAREEAQKIRARIGGPPDPS